MSRSYAFFHIGREFKGLRYRLPYYHPYAAPGGSPVLEVREICESLGLVREALGVTAWEGGGLRV